MRKPRIAVIGLKGLPAFGGAARVGESIISRLHGRYEFTVYATGSHASADQQFDGFRQLVLDEFPVGSLNIPFYYLRSALHCVRSETYDLVHLHHVDAAFIVPILRRKYKVLGTAHGRPQFNTKWSSMHRWYFSKMERLFLRSVDQVVAVAHPHAASYRELTRTPVHVITNGVEQEPAFAAKIDEKPGYVLFVAGRIIDIKGCHTLLAALKELQYRGRVLVIGHLDERSAYGRALRHLAEGLDVRFIPLIKDLPTLMAYYSSARIFVFPSTLEAMSSVLLEAASAKVGLVCSDIDENTALFDRSEALFFRAGDSRDLAQKMSFAMTNPELLRANAERAHAKLVSDYSWDSIAEQYDRLYSSLLDEVV